VLNASSGADSKYHSLLKLGFLLWLLTFIILCPLPDCIIGAENIWSLERVSMKHFDAFSTYKDTY